VGGAVSTTVDFRFAIPSFDPDLSLLFKLHEIWSVDCQENN